jgi:RNA polymerase sigma factor (sigma-70 family)
MGVDKPLHLLPSHELMTRCGMADDLAAWEEFILRFHKRIVNYVVRDRRSRGLADNETEAALDLTQEVYLRLLANDRRALRDFSGKSDASVIAYLASIANSVVTDHARKQKSLKRDAPLVSINDKLDDESNLCFADMLPAAEDNSPDRIVNERLTIRRLRELLASTLSGPMAGRDSIIFQLHVIGGHTARDIAELPNFKMTVFSVEAVLRRTRERLRVALGSSDAPGLSV